MYRDYAEGSEIRRCLCPGVVCTSETKAFEPNLSLQDRADAVLPSPCLFHIQASNLHNYLVLLKCDFRVVIHVTQSKQRLSEEELVLA